MSPLIYELPGILRVSPLSGGRSDAPAGEEGEKIEEEAQIESLQPHSGVIMWIGRAASDGPGRLGPRPLWSLAPPTHVGAKGVDSNSLWERS